MYKDLLWNLHMFHQHFILYIVIPNLFAVLFKHFFTSSAFFPQFSSCAIFPASSRSLETFCQQILLLTFASLHTFEALKNSCNFSLSPALRNTGSIWQETLPFAHTDIPGMRPLFSEGLGPVGGRLHHEHFTPSPWWLGFLCPLWKTA